MSNFRIHSVGPQSFPLQSLLRAAAADVRSPFALRSELDRAMNDVVANGNDGLIGNGREDATGFTLEFEVPGIVPDTIEVLAEDGVLTIRGRRPTRESGENERELFDERPHGTFERRLRFPKSADLTAINASYGRGVLTVRVAKLAPAQPRRIEILAENTE